jgi:hypothetical protein
MQVVYDLTTNAFIVDLNYLSGCCQCTPPRLHVPVAHALNTSPEIQVIQVYPWQILVFPARNYPTSVGHVYQNTLRYWG